MKRFMLLVLIAMIGSTSAAIYVNQADPNSVEYSDTPSANAKEVVVPPTNSVSPRVVEAPGSNTAASGSAATAGAGGAVLGGPASTESTYSTFSITAPKDGDTLQNEPVTSVEMKVNPTMLPGDKIQLFVDSKPVGTPNATNYQEISILERGTHTLYGKIINVNGTSIKRSNSITLYVHRNSTVTSPLTPPPPAPKAQVVIPPPSH